MSHRARTLKGPITDRALPEGTMGNRTRGYGRELSPYEVSLQKSLRELAQGDSRIPQNAEALRSLAITLLSDNWHLLRGTEITLDLVRTLLQKSFEEESR